MQGVQGVYWGAGRDSRYSGARRGGGHWDILGFTGLLEPLGGHRRGARGVLGLAGPLGQRPEGV